MFAFAVFVPARFFYRTESLSLSYDMIMMLQRDAVPMSLFEETLVYHTFDGGAMVG